MATGSIFQTYLTDPITPGTKLRYEDLLRHNRDNKGGDFLNPLNYSLGILDNTDKVLLPYLDDAKKAQLYHDLQIAYVLLHAEKKYEHDHQKTENARIYTGQIKRCSELLNALDPAAENRIVEMVLENISEEMPVKYLGITLGAEFAKQLVELTDHKSKTLKDAMGALNEKRLYWIWGSSFIKTVLSLIPADFFNATQAGSVIRAPEPYTGCLSWTLYYFRFSFNLCLLLKHTIAGPWMSAEEAQTPWYERFQTQWALRKFTLLNDSLWGTANLLCYFWLNGKGALGVWGDALTVVLLVFDISVALWDFAEQQTQHNAQLQQYQADIDLLNSKIEELNQSEIESPKKVVLLESQIEALNKANIMDMSEDDLSLLKSLTELKNKIEQDTKEKKSKELLLLRQINALNDAKEKCAMEWRLQKLGLYTNIAYAVGLMGAFVLMTMPFIPLSAAAAFSLGIAGAVLCFAFTVINSAVKGGMEIYKTHQSLKSAKQDFAKQIKSLNALLADHSNAEENEIQTKFLFLEIKKLHSETEYQKQMVMLQTVHLVRSIMIEALIPAVIFACLVFLPLGIGLAALGAALGLAIASNLLVNALFKPDPGMRQLPDCEKEDFNANFGAEYAEFSKLIETNTSPKSAHVFFKAAGLEVDLPRFDLGDEETPLLEA